VANSTAPILAAGGISFANHWIGNNQGIDMKILVATAVAAGGLALLEKVPDMEPLATGLAYIVLVTVLIAPFGKGKSPVQNALKVTGL
jgi:hypothetical protein